jgi:DNA repair protein RAD50
MEAWKAELERYQKLLPMAAQLSSMRNKDLPDLEQQLKEQKGSLPGFISKHEDVSSLFGVFCTHLTSAKIADKLKQASKDLKEMGTLKQTALLISNLRTGIDQLTQEVSSLEQDLSKTGSTKTVSQLNDEQDELKAKM